ncbi:hydrogenase expression/formation protein HypE [bacterium]|nr:hydrogenase expression/formation protein HypE [bacterium]
MTKDSFSLSCPLPNEKGSVIRLGHGSGGRMSHELFEHIFLPAFNNEILAKRQDAAIIELESKNIAISTDSYVVNPIFFPGGDIGSLCVHGTINDLCMQGAEPLYITTSFIIEEGFAIDDLKKIVSSICQAASQTNVKVIAGDTKVVNRGAADKIFINTTGIGKILLANPPGATKVNVGDSIIVSGDLARHGMAVMCARNSFELETQFESDSAPLNEMVLQLINEGIELHCLRDITRGGLATCLNEIAEVSGMEIEIEHSNIPLIEPVQSACEILGLDPLFVACEGRLIAIVPENFSDSTLAIMRQYEIGDYASKIGTVHKSAPGRVILKTSMGARRILDMLSGEQLPRIC